MISFSNKVALVTGGSRGIGAATVKAIVSAGGSVVIHYGSNIKAAKLLAEEVGSSQCHIVSCDLSEPGAASRLWRDAIAWKGQIDIVVNNAGIFLAEKCDGPDEEWQNLWQRTLQVNLIATADLCREAVNHWRAKNTGGCIVNVASRAAFRGDSPDHWAYAASKGAIISLTKTLARAYSGQGIFTYAVAPGFVLTDMALAAFESDPTLRDRVVSEIPLGDIAPASQLANAICFLASGLATHATGQTLDINGASYVR
ncbi:MAG: SDR family oxidoreductase [Gammaproteobacteria bacterium]|nr:SDR family oxidoreductase [Gammaproteobacteria bacterium]